MKKIIAYMVAVAAGIMSASCSGHGGSSALPTTMQNVTHNNNSTSAVAVSTAPAGWASTSTLGASVANATDLGALNPSQTLTIRVGLQLHNVPQLQSAIASGVTMDAGTFKAQYAPTDSEAASVANYLSSQGFTAIQSEPNNMMVSATGTAAQVSKAFNTTLHGFSLGGANVYANTTPAYVPTSLNGVAIAVLGLNNAAKMGVKPLSSPTDCFPQNPAPSGTPCVRNYDAPAIQTFYDAKTAPTGANTTMAVMAEGDVTQTIADLRYMETQEGLPQVPVTSVQVGLASGDTAGAAEWNLDTQSSTGIAQTVKALYIYHTTSLTDSDIALEYNKWVTDNKAQLGNSSFGECEYQAWLDGSMRIDDQVMMQAAAQGQTMFASSGDTGSSCALVGTNGVPGSGPPMVEYPSASPYIVSVGGTSAFSNNDYTYNGEAAWNAGGGGLSQFENSTSWQQQAQPNGGTLAAANLRSLPDIAMAADPNAGGYLVWFQQGLNGGTYTCNECGIGGTSEASPLAMGSYARMLSAKPSLGFAAPKLYHNYIANGGSITNANPNNGQPPTQAVGGFHDILTGVNGAYSATPGYDYTTGLGSLDVAVMAAQL